MSVRPSLRWVTRDVKSGAACREDTEPGWLMVFGRAKGHFRNGVASKGPLGVPR